MQETPSLGEIPLEIVQHHVLPHLSDEDCLIFAHVCRAFKRVCSKERAYVSGARMFVILGLQSKNRFFGELAREFKWQRLPGRRSWSCEQQSFCLHQHNYFMDLIETRGFVNVAFARSYLSRVQPDIGFPPHVTSDTVAATIVRRHTDPAFLQVFLEYIAARGMGFQWTVHSAIFDALYSRLYEGGIEFVRLLYPSFHNTTALTISWKTFEDAAASEAAWWRFYNTLNNAL